jgi:phospholipid/cholesterol/gamma-HCH transport system permease protein
MAGVPFARERGFEERLVGAPGYARLESAGHMGGLLLRTIRTMVKPPFTWRAGLVDECGLTIRRCTLPLLVSIWFLNVGIVIALVVGLVGMIGTIDRAGAGVSGGTPRETGFWVTGMVFAGVVGSAMTADLGARKVREELDAMSVLGVDTVKTLIVPRVLALTLMAPVLGMIALMNATGAIWLTSPLFLPNTTRGAYVEASLSTINATDTASFLLRLAVAGMFVGIVSCSKGLTARGGAEGVGRAVNQAVLICFLGIWILNSLWNAVFLPTFPDVTVLRG